MSKVDEMNKIMNGMHRVITTERERYTATKGKEFYNIINAIVDAVNELNQKLQNNK